MDTAYLKDLLRTVARCPSRRELGQVLAGLLVGVTARPLAARQAEARKRKKRKKKCKGGKSKCGKGCCAAAELCGDPQTSRCVAGQGTCPDGANSCGAGGVLTTCNASDQCFCVEDTSGTTRCGAQIPGISITDCGHCLTADDCRALFPNVVGVFCGRDASGECGCPVGQNICGAPCPAS